jgi:hypothetical protein
MENLVNEYCPKTVFAIRAWPEFAGLLYMVISNLHGKQGAFADRIITSCLGTSPNTIEWVFSWSHPGMQHGKYRITECYAAVFAAFNCRIFACKLKLWPRCPLPVLQRSSSFDRRFSAVPVLLTMLLC